MDSSETKSQETKRKLIIESPDLLLLEKIEIFTLRIHWAQYGHLKVWSKIDKFDLSGIATKNCHRIVKFNPNLDLLRLFCG
jgi:hypothetical protein